MMSVEFSLKHWLMDHDVGLCVEKIHRLLANGFDNFRMTMSCICHANATSERSAENLQACLERTPQARQYHSDAFPAYDNLYCGTPYEMCSDKKETYSVEAVNADLRHYLKRLARKSRCFSRRLGALLKNLRIFAYCYNQRQLMKQKYPPYKPPLIDFPYPL